MGAASTLSLPALSALGFSPAVASITHIVGLLSMLIMERRLSSRRLDSSPDELSPDTPSSRTVAATEDMELRERLQTDGTGAQYASASRTAQTLGPHQRRVYLFIFAFVFVELAVGIGAGHGGSSSPTFVTDDDRPMPSLPGRVTTFLLGLIGKVATTLGFATTLLSASLPTAECKRYVLLYTAAAPLASLLSYSVTVLSRVAPSYNRLPIIVLHAFADGMFVYAALVVRLLICSPRTPARNGLLARVSLIAAGAFLPYILLMVVTIARMWYYGTLSRDKADTEEM
ncbi:hypothetical protein GSI_06916 [Ganoderma sinense ZZ0214-1]|uniref:Uncharacterized protein n=1 Tax=Ganoderma sinense ZZ0214-1 TaxID=1077348 RepID=A0A2G8SAW8_9APHY|nr:hypothetical protein GSI_06916 [Ganoderma sinense ZZ0214-1]